MLGPFPQPTTRRWNGQILRREQRLEVDALRAELSRKIEEPRLARALVDVEHRHESLVPSELAPPIERRSIETVQQRTKAPLNRRENARVAGRVVVLREHLVREQDRPEVVALRHRVFGIRTVPAVSALVSHDEIDVTRDPRLQRLVVDEPRQRNDTVEPVRRAFPSFGGSAEPLALTHVRPEFVEMPAQAVRLNSQLALQPASRTDRSERQRMEHRVAQC